MIIRTTSMTVTMTVPVTVSVTVLMKMMMTLKDRAVNGTGNGHLCEVSFCFLAGMISLSCAQMYQHIDGTFQTDNPFTRVQITKSSQQ